MKNTNMPLLKNVRPVVPKQGAHLRKPEVAAIS